MVSYVRLFATPWTAAFQTRLSMELPRQEYWCGLPFPPPGNLLDPGIKPMSPESPVLTGRYHCATWEADVGSSLCKFGFSALMGLIEAWQVKKRSSVLFSDCKILLLCNRRCQSAQGIVNWCSLALSPHAHFVI